MDIFKTFAKKYNLPIKVNFNVSFGIIIPSTTGIDILLNINDFNKRITDTQNDLGKLYGGFSTYLTHGGYFSKIKNKMIKEDTSIVISYIPYDDFNNDKYMEKLFCLLKKYKKTWNQEVIGILIEHNLIYI